ncbi:MAG: minor capsid protein [Lachnospiraceae bacterium]|nr:minor capsid protein [Lachnospiraceae bacterium]
MKQEYQSILQNGIEKKYIMLEEEIQKDIVRRIQKTGKITSTADWQIQRYMVLGHSTEDVENIIRQTVGGDWADTFRLYDEVIEQEYVRGKALYEQVNAYFVPYEQNYELQQITNALIQQSNDELFNISKSLGFMVDMGNGRKVFSPLSEIYNGYMDNAITMMASGAFDYNTLIRKVVGEMTASGLRTVDYASGYSNRVDVAVRRALLTGMGQLTGHIADMNGQMLGTDKFEVDWHMGARPEHAVWQGRVWTHQQLIDICGLGDGPGLLGWSCRHTYYPFIEGISVRNYSDEWLEEMNRKEAQKISYRGREYNAYEATQKQRQMETAMRAQREKAMLLKEGGADPDDILNARCKYQAMLNEYKEFSRKFNLPEQRERIYADLHGRVAPSQRTYKKWQAEQAEKAAKRAAEKERLADRAMRIMAEQARRADMDKAMKSGIIKQTEMPVKKVYKSLTEEEFKAIKHSITKAERKIIYGKTHFSGYVNSSNARKINAMLREGQTLSGDYKDIELALKGVIGRHQLPEDIIVTRYVADDALEGMFGVKVPVYKIGGSKEDYWKEFDKLPQALPAGLSYTEKGFLSTSGVADNNVMSDKGIKMIIKAPKGTPAYVTTNYRESEIIFGEGTTLHVTNCYIENPRTAQRKVVLECEMR